jgi:hypothetical protein
MTPDDLPADGHKAKMGDIQALLSLVESLAPTDLPVLRGLRLLQRWTTRPPDGIITKADFS